MTDKSEIPADLRKAARDVVTPFLTQKGPIDGFALDRAIAVALMAERKKAAQIGYVTCAQTRHVRLGDQVAAAIIAGTRP